MRRAWLARVAVIVAVALGASVAVAGQAQANGFTYYHATRSVSRLEVTKQILVEPGPHGVYYATHFNFDPPGVGGYQYFGMQSHNGVHDGYREAKMFLFSTFSSAVTEARTSNPNAWCHMTSEAGAPSCRLFYDWRQGYTYRFVVSEVEPHWWQVKVIEEDTGVEFEIGQMKTPQTWGGIQPDTDNFTEEFSGFLPGTTEFPYSKIRLGHADGDSGLQFAYAGPGDLVRHDTGVTNVIVTCDDVARWCEQENNFALRPATPPPPRPVLVKPAGDVAAGKPVLSWPQEAYDNNPILAVDTSLASSWTSFTGQPGAWLRVDLQGHYQLDRIVVDWDHNPDEQPKTYTVQTSLDGRAWTDVVTAGQPVGGPTTHPIPANAPLARYLRVHIDQPASGYGVRIWDLQAFPRACPTPTATNRVTECDLNP